MTDLYEWARGLPVFLQIPIGLGIAWLCQTVVAGLIALALYARDNF